MTLVGETTGAVEPGKRVAIQIAPSARQALSNLLYQREMRGVGYSEFILRAVDVAVAELEGLQR